MIFRAWFDKLADYFPSGLAGVPWRDEFSWEYLATAVVVYASAGLCRELRVLKADCHDEHARKPCEGGLASVLGPDVVLLELDGVVVDTMRQRGDVLDIQLGSILDIPFEAGFFDLVCDFSTLDHIDPLMAPRALREYHRVLKPNGCLLLFVWESGNEVDIDHAYADGAQPYGPNHQFYFAVDAPERWAVEAGFKTVSSAWFPSDGERLMARYIFKKE